MTIIHPILRVHMSQITRYTLQELPKCSIPGLTVTSLGSESQGFYIEIDTTVARLENLKERYPILKGMPDLLDMVSVAQATGCGAIFINPANEQIVPCLPTYQYREIEHPYRGKCYVECAYLNGRLISKIMKVESGHIVESILKHDFQCAKDW